MTLDEAVVENEVELKFAVPRGYPTPPPTTLGTCGTTLEFELNALYFDTPDLRLNAHGTTLRRRSGGGDAGWHLKTTGADAQHRVELRVPISGARPPRRLRDALPQELRSAPLVPVVRILTMRTQTPVLNRDGSVQAEYCLDRVWVAEPDEPQQLASTAPSWVELEVELRTPDTRRPGEIADQLRKQGLRAARHASKLKHALEIAGTPTQEGQPAGLVVQYVWRQVGLLQALEEAVLADEPDAVHQARVAVRRLRSTLKTFSSGLGIEDPGGLEHELKWYASLLGQARDGEVLQARLDGILEDEGVAPAELAALRARLHAERVEHVQVLRRAMRSPRYEVLQDQLNDLCSATLNPGTAADGWEAAALARQLGRTARIFLPQVAGTHGAQGQSFDPVAYHRARKAAKRVRYGYEALLSGRPSAVLSAWKEATETLGTLQDEVLLRDSLQAAGCEESARDWAETSRARLRALAVSGRDALIAALEQSVFGGLGEHEQ